MEKTINADWCSSREYKDGKYISLDGAPTESDIEIIIGCKKCLAWWRKQNFH